MDCDLFITLTQQQPPLSTFQRIIKLRLQVCHGFPFINLAGSGETVNGLSVQISISSSVLVTCQLSQSSPRRLCRTLTQTPLLYFRRRQRQMRHWNHRPLIEWHTRGVRKIVAQLTCGFICNPRARRRVQRDSSHLTNRRGIAISWYRCATRAQRAARATMQGAARVNGTESPRAT